jgi:hypothetical protein
LPVADRAVEDVAADGGIRCGILENAGAGDPGTFDASAREKLTPFASGVGVRDVDGLGVEGDRAGTEAGDGGEATGAGGIDPEKEVLAFLSGHARGVLG